MRQRPRTTSTSSSLPTATPKTTISPCGRSVRLRQRPSKRARVPPPPAADEQVAQRSHAPLSLLVLPDAIISLCFTVFSHFFFLYFLRGPHISSSPLPVSGPCGFAAYNPREQGCITPFSLFSLRRPLPVLLHTRYNSLLFQ